MHEWALAEALISTVSKVVKEEGFRKIIEVKIRVGVLQQIDLNILEFAISQLKPRELEDAEFVIELTDTRFRCRVCGHSWKFDMKRLDESTREAIHFLPEIAHAYIRCPNCGSMDFEVLEGRGVWVESIRGE